MQKRVKCPACESVAYVKPNNRGDEYFTCSRCGPWNGKGPAFREWCRSLSDIDHKPDTKSDTDSEHQLGLSGLGTVESSPVPPERKSADWLQAWGES